MCFVRPVVYFIVTKGGRASKLMGGFETQSYW